MDEFHNLFLFIITLKLHFDDWINFAFGWRYVYGEGVGQVLESFLFLYFKFLI
jgi:hypothetical protein